MIYITNNCTDPAYNIALEEFAFKKLLNQDQIFILWINQPAIIVGRYQNIIQEINMEYIRNNNINVVRRISGGGTVYHDHGNLNYTIIAKEEKDRPFDFKIFAKPVIETLAKLNVKAELTNRNDIVIKGKKICGTAQAYSHKRLMYHGCLLFDTDISVLEKTLDVSDEHIESKAVKSVRSKVVNIKDELKEKITIEEFKSLLMKYMRENVEDFREYILSKEDIECINNIKTEKFSNWDWVYGRSPKYTLKRNVNYGNEKLYISIDVENSIIQNVSVDGNSEDIISIKELANSIVGIKYTYHDVWQYINGKNIKGIDCELIVKAIID